MSYCESNVIYFPSDFKQAEKMSLLQSIKRSPVAHFWLLIVFLASGLVMNCLQIIILLTWPINRSLYRWLVSKVSYLYLAGLAIVIFQHQNRGILAMTKALGNVFKMRTLSYLSV